ncbi:hypothetical protein D3C85_1296810 [compost metagenome]
MTHTAGLSTSNTIAETSPDRLPRTAPRVVRPFQYIERNSTGKFTDAAMASTRPERKAMFCDSNSRPRMIASTPMHRVAIRDTRISCCSLAWPLRITQAYRSWDTAEAPDSASPATTARMVAKATAEMKPRNRLPPTA